jgi:hypothetical protein
MRTDERTNRRTDGRTDMTKLAVAVRIVANASKCVNAVTQIACFPSLCRSNRSTMQLTTFCTWNAEVTLELVKESTRATIVPLCTLCIMFDLIKHIADTSYDES